MAKNEARKAIRAMQAKDPELLAEYRRQRRNLQSAIRYRKRKGMDIGSAPKIPKNITPASVRNLQRRKEKLPEVRYKPTQTEIDYKKQQQLINRRVKYWNRKGVDVTYIPDFTPEVEGIVTLRDVKRLQDYDIQQYLKYGDLTGREAKLQRNKELREERKKQKAIEEEKKIRHEKQIAELRKERFQRENKDALNEGAVIYVNLFEMMNSAGVTEAGRVFINEWCNDMKRELGYDKFLMYLRDAPPEFIETVQQVLKYEGGQEQSKTQLIAQLTKMGELLTQDEARELGNIDYTGTWFNDAFQDERAATDFNWRRN